MKKTVLKICGAEWNNASRDKRELSVCRDLGFETLVMAKGDAQDRFREDTVAGFRVLRFSTRPLGAHVPNGVNRVVSLFTWAHDARKIHPDIITGHDMIGLTIGWMSNWFRRDKAKLVYDSHEFNIERSGSRGKTVKFLTTHMERFLMRRCAFSIMVNDSIAQQVQQIHRLPEKPVVVRNIPPLWQVDEEACRLQRSRFLQELNLPEETFLLMYHGAVMKDRGVESLIEQVKRNPHTAGIILGNGSDAYLEQLHAQAESAGVADRVLFHPAVPHEQLWKYVGAADVGMVTVMNTCVSYYYMLPNKFFENIQSLTPIIGSAFPEVQRLIEQYEIGLTCDPADMDAMAECIEKMRTDKVFYNQCKKNLYQAKADLNWEKECQRLEEAYKALM